jgi:flagellar assembly protein FliH
MSSSPERGPDPALFRLRLPAASAGPVLMLEEARAAARAQGYAAGWAAGNRQVRAATKAQLEQSADHQQQLGADRSARLEQALSALALAATGLERLAGPALREADETVLRAAVQLTRVLVGRELALATQPGLDALRRALVHTPANRPVTVFLSPADLATLTDTASSVRTVDGRRVTLLADPTLGSGDAVAECDAVRVDARLAAALDRLDEALS